jgi:Ni,Fe-hydrogenase I small subunit
LAAGGVARHRSQTSSGEHRLAGEWPHGDCWSGPSNTEVSAVSAKTLLWIGCGGCSGETQAVLGVEGQVFDIVDLIDVDGLRILWHPSLAEADLWPILDDLSAGREQLTVLCVEGSVALAQDGMFDIAGEVGKFRVVRALCELADYVLAMGACAAYGGWQAQAPNPSGAVGLQFSLESVGGLLPSGWRSRAGMPVISLAGCPVPADTQVAAIRWVFSGAPGGVGRYGMAPMVRPCLSSTEYRGSGTPRRIGLRCTGCIGPKFPNLGDRRLVRWAQ